MTQANQPPIERRSIDCIPQAGRHASLWRQITGALALVHGGDMFRSPIGLPVPAAPHDLVARQRALSAPARRVLPEA